MSAFVNCLELDRDAPLTSLSLSLCHDRHSALILFGRVMGIAMGAKSQAADASIADKLKFQNVAKKLEAASKREKEKQAALRYKEKAAAEAAAKKQAIAAAQNK